LLVVDANVLINALNEDAQEHEVAGTWLFDALSGHEPVGFSWSALLAVIRISTHGALLPAPLTIGQVAREIDAWLGAAPAVIVEPTRQHLSVLAGLIRAVGVGGNLVNDAHLAALALEHDATVISFDRDFGRFEGVRWRLPG
jgi:uncharacterized protein